MPFLNRDLEEGLKPESRVFSSMATFEMSTFSLGSSLGHYGLEGATRPRAILIMQRPKELRQLISRKHRGFAGGDHEFQQTISSVGQKSPKDEAGR